MSPLRNTRKSRRLSQKSPVDVADYDWHGAASLHLLHGRSDVSPATHLLPPSPSASTTTSSDSPSAIVTHLPFTPGSSHTRNRKQGHIPRPPNPFMVFRSWLWNKDNLKSIERDNRNVSRIAGRYWNALSDTERAPFRFMAEEAKARHAQLYPDYRYSPGSQKKPKGSQRRPQRTTDIDTEKCNKVADLLLGHVTTHDWTKYLGDAERTPLFVPEPTLSGPHHPAPPTVLKRPPAVSASLQPTFKRPKTLPAPLVPISPPQHAVPTFSFDEEKSETAQTPLARTPELTCPPDDVPVFVPTADIPYFSLDGCSDLTVHAPEDGFSFSFPSHLRPAANSIFSAIKPEATSFVNSCMLGATTDPLILPSPVPFTEFDIDSYPSLVPLGSPVFSNPFEPSPLSAEYSTLLDTLDQLFGRPISPLTSVYPIEN